MFGDQKPLNLMSYRKENLGEKGCARMFVDNLSRQQVDSLKFVPAAHKGLSISARQDEEGIRTHNQLIRSYLLELKLLWF